MTPDRFAYDRNLERATHYRAWRSAFWPPANDYQLFCLDLAANAPALEPAVARELESLRGLIEIEWHRCKVEGIASKALLGNAEAVAKCLRRIAGSLPTPADRQALELRANAVERGYDERALDVLATIDEEVAFVAGKLSSWYGKHGGRLPAAFGCVRDSAGRAAVAAANARLDDIAAYVRNLHADLRLGRVPAFSAMRLFFIAGEGNSHPKHIAYFLPENEGVKYSPFKKTYYFVNTHAAILNFISLPLARRFIELGRPLAASAADLQAIPTLGVLAHEMGHFVHREGVTFAALNDADRWASVVLQETVADVFGTLIVAELLAPSFQRTAVDVIGYHLAECLRYVDRGLGHFPDSDGMFLQLNYLTAFGALDCDAQTGRLRGDPDVVLAGFRSLARVLADTLLAGDVSRTMALYRSYGPAAAERLQPLVAALRAAPPKTIEYVQEPPLEVNRSSLVAVSRA